MFLNILFSLLISLTCNLITDGYAVDCIGEFQTIANISFVTVTTSRGDVMGTHEDYGSDKADMFYGAGDVFRGIPYVQAPIGANRWKKPVALKTFASSPWNATYNRPACPQQGNNNINEDCLFLNIYSPNAKSTKKYPVMIWIHGGSLKTGGIGGLYTEAIMRNFVSRGVVLVTIQYRLGMLGYFTTFTEDFPANRGSLDQTEAIRWVSEEIYNFGGNPFQITLFGESAGAASVSAHTLSPLSQPLFQQAIMESGTVLTCFDGALGFQNTSVLWAQQLCNFTSTDWNSYNYSRLWDCIATMDYNVFLPLDSNLIMGWQMVQDNLFLPDTPAKLAKVRPNIPVIYGNCKDEWAAFEMGFVLSGTMKLTDFNKSNFQLFLLILASFLGDREEDVQNMLEMVYLKPGTKSDDYLGWMKMQSNAFTSAAFTSFISREVKWYLDNANSKVYTYELTYATDVGRPLMIPGWSPVYHAEDLKFIFMNKQQWETAASNGMLRNDDFTIANFFADKWTNFAKYSQPSLDASFWPATNATMNYLDVNPEFKVKLNYRQVDDTLWNKVMPPLIGEWPQGRPYFDNGTNAYTLTDRSGNAFRGRDWRHDLKEGNY